MSQGTTKSLKSLQQAFEIIEHLKQTDGAGVTEVANELGLPKSTAHIYLSTLEDIGYVVNRNHRYYVGLRFLDVGETVRNQRQVYEVGYPEINDLARETGELVSLTVLENGKGVYLYRAKGENSIPVHNYPGSRVHLHCRSAGKAILAHLSSRHVEEIIEKHGLPARTEKTITDRSVLWNELERIRERKYATNEDELRQGLRCVAAPILDNGQVIGAVSVSGPRGRMTGQRFREDLPNLVQNTANIIGINLTYS
ncbi:IclR family transcriptional regulator [Haladaptatus sp. R4]|uniref:IclR family transcriptional regulator n=1 Tax=Haladaptatus sp. R4 TaxID=1679489 RepID=UPI0007B45D71|nr:IclR family transcriptional regulator [Haladaptatus sp. R4]KZN23173.1 IclR family transcriptional regulator [Haladaptatus sp. R4]